MKRFILVSIALVTVSVFAEEPVKCPVDQVCPKLKESFAKCEKNKKSKSCDEFVDAYAKLVPHYDCKRSFDTGPVPAIWVCDEMNRGSYPTLEEKAAKLLSELKSKKGRAFFGSPEFRSTLDGELAEEYMRKSEKVGKSGSH